MEPWQNWTAVLLVAGAAYAYYNQTKDSEKRKPSEPSKVVPHRAKTDQRSKSSGVSLDTAKFHPKDELNSGTSTPKKAKRQKQKKDKGTEHLTSAPSAAAPVENDDEEPEVASNDKEWAEQLSAAKQGVKLSVPEKNVRQKSPKRQKGAVAAQDSWDETPAQVDSFNTTSGENLGYAPVKAGDVSDMLEAAAPGPSVLRVTGEAKPQKPKAPQAAAPVQETKKQRQNRKKAEEKKLTREQDEKERKVLEENQRRSAREARGEPAKNGLGSVQVPTSNAWSQTSKPNGSITQAPAVKAPAAPLLDTFEQDTNSTGSSNEQPNQSTTPSTSASILDQDLPSEEAQMEMLSKMNGDASWNEVTKPKKSKKKAPTGNASPERLPKENGTKPSNQYSSIPSSQLISEGAKTPERATKKIASTNGFAALEAATGFTPGGKGHPDDSDWAVE